MKRLLIFATILGLTLPPATPVFAADEYDPTKIIYEARNDISFRQNGNESSNAVCASTMLPPTTAKIPAEDADRITRLKTAYLEASTATNVRWEVIAAIDYRESGNDPNKSTLDGLVFGVQSKKDPRFKPQSKMESMVNAMTLLKEKQFIYNVDPTKPMSFSQLQSAFVTYATHTAYQTAQQAPETSPYVMNLYDDAHKNMVYPNIPGEPMAKRRETRLGAAAIFANLIAEGDNNSECVGAGVGAKVDYSQLWHKIDAGTLKDNLLCTPYRTQPGFKLLAGPACESFKALAADYKRVFNKTMPVGGGYRTKELQIEWGGTIWNPGGTNPAAAAYDPNYTPPGHLWGTAIDFAGPLFTSGTREHTWLVKNGPRFGWFWPNWASGGRGGNAGVVEDWHFGYYFIGHNPKTDDIEGLTDRNSSGN